MQRLLFGAFSIWLSATPAFGADACSFWVWNRHDALRPEERQILNGMSAKLIWAVGELDAASQDSSVSVRTPVEWRWRDSLPESGALPVVRVDLSGADPFGSPELLKALGRLADPQGRLQIDCDCPDRLLDSYALFLGKLRQRVPHLSITGLVHWSKLPVFADLQGNVEALAPMFYDFAPDPIHVGPDAHPLPLLDPQILQRQLASWGDCKAQWQAGLPNFSRVTVYDTTGHSLGQIRNWTWDEVTFQAGLRFVSAPGPGVILLRAARNLILAETPIKEGSYISVRSVDRQALIQALSLVKQSRATGPIFFRLPDSTDPSGWSVAQIGTLMAGEIGEPKLNLSKTGDRLVLTNASETDLPPRIAGDGAGGRGYALELDAPSTLWREAVPGDFWRVAAHTTPDTRPTPVPVPFATRLTLWFSQLRAGGTLKTGLIQLAPDADFRQIHYRILPGDPTWKTID